MIPSLYQPVVDPMDTVNAIKQIGADRCLIGSDFGQVLHLDAVPGIRVFIRALLGFGVSRDEIKTMFSTNPARLLYLED
jgi:microsomal dipeptidase-like Zn-dependent dipeptidase